ncbi:hypothetical protein OIU84_015485 [Salix udensis]|uniref:DUF4283 domain-containing protein n=1 Tax=Salix udensis TaxID=889485 RepID=A0AAD6NN60_9ROSI|nr:hypothetical protein OIU84_015485 [Salix udensis]
MTPSTQPHAPNTHTAPTISTWAEKVRISDATTRFTLDPISRKPAGSQMRISEEMLTANVGLWNRSMVGFIPGFKMSHRMVNTIASRVWKSCGLQQVSTMANGFMVFRFSTEDEVHAVIEKGPWLFGGKAILLQQWHPSFRFDKNKISKLPVWIDASLPKISSFDIISPLSSDPITVEMEYEWMPPHCTSCKIYGHSCKKPRQPIVPETNMVTGAKPITNPQPPLPSTTKSSIPNEDGFITVTAKGKAKVTNQNPSTNPPPKQNLSMNQNQPTKGPSQITTLTHKDPSTSQTIIKVNNPTNPSPITCKEVPQDKEQLKHHPNPHRVPTEDHTSIGHMDETCPLSKMDSLGSQSFSKVNSEDALSIMGTTDDDYDQTPSPSTKKKKKGGSWNTWGLNNPNKLRSVKSWINKFQLHIVGLLETKIAAHNLPQVESKLNLNGWNFISNISDGDPCRILIAWDPFLFNLTCIHSNPQWITCEAASVTTGEIFLITYVYGCNTPAGREPLWNYLSTNCHQFSIKPWVIMGDFNAIMHPSQRSGGDTQWHNHHEEFRRASHQAELISLPYQGMNFTWNNDREDFIPKVQEAWQVHVEGNPMRKLLGKLRNVKNALKIFHKNNTSRISERVATANTAWNLAQINLDKDPTTVDLQDREHRAARLFASLSRDEEAILKQKSRVQRQSNLQSSNHGIDGCLSF